MAHMRRFSGLLALGLLALSAATAEARTPSVRTNGMRTVGDREDITVPYLENGRNAFGAYYVRPRIYSSQQVDDPVNPGARQVYNLPFYGGIQAFGDRSNGAVPRSTKITPR